MTFLALLTKELRLRLRAERSVWVIVIYILLLGLIGWFFITASGNNGGDVGSIGSSLFILLAALQLFLIIFITPAYTSTAINGEKERQTFDLLLCSRLSPLSLVSGKLVAGLTNSLLLIAASIPLFSLVFFFGGVAPTQLLSLFLVYSITALLLGAFGLFCSILFKRQTLSTTITYLGSLLWLLLPLLIYIILMATSNGQALNGQQQELLFIWHPGLALLSTSTVYLFGTVANLSIGSLSIVPWVAYIILSLVATGVFFILSMWLVKPNRSGIGSRSKKQPITESKATATA